MATQRQGKQLRKELGLFGVFAVSTGTTLSAGLFLLPGLAARDAGNAIILCYMLAVIPLIPAVLSIIELGTAMPRAGGAYYFLDRSLGPLAGTIGGLGTWCALMLKSSFALIGMGAYIALFLPDLPAWGLKSIAATIAILLGIVNWMGARKSGQAQILLVMGLLMILAWFISQGVIRTDLSHFADFLGPLKDGTEKHILATAGLVYISYIGITKVASVSEEIKNPERNLPLGVFMSLIASVAIYALCTGVMIGATDLDTLVSEENYLTPMATTAETFGYRWGVPLISTAALLAFFSVANAGILSSSRYPLAMGRDHLLPRAFAGLNKKGVPTLGIIVTVGIIVATVILLDPMRIVKLASAFQLLMFALLCLAVIVMRESHIESYDPGYRSPFYPWTQIVGIIAPFILIAAMGTEARLFSAGLIVFGIAWYQFYARQRVARHGAIYHIFERLGRRRFDALDDELRAILKEKGLREDDPFDECIVRASVIDLDEATSYDDVIERAAAFLALDLHCSEETIAEGFREGTRIGATPVSGSTALPHLRLPNVPSPSLVIARCRSGLQIPTGPSGGSELKHAGIVKAIFFLVSPDDDPARHLRMLAQLASLVEQDEFLARWLDAADEHALKETLLRQDRFVTITLTRNKETELLVNMAIKDLDLPEGCLVAIIRRGGEMIIPKGNTVLLEGDQITVIGEDDGMESFRRQYAHSPWKDSG